jgi:hypothetical protein
VQEKFSSCTIILALGSFFAYLALFYIAISESMVVLSMKGLPSFGVLRRGERGGGRQRGHGQIFTALEMS